MTSPLSTARDIPDLPILSVSQLTHAIKLSLEATFPLVCVQGEISNFKKQASGHLYFSLKDNNAQIAVVMFRGEAVQLRQLPKDGDQVIVRGELNVYAPRGNYQLIIRELRPVGLGELLLKLEALKAKLQQRGWFDKSTKKLLPRYPRKIGVVTSPTGAVIQDILNVLTRRFAGFHLILNPVRVQGEGAANEIARAIDDFNKFALVDVIIVARGGGSIEDLWAFNEENVAAAIHNSLIPVVSAVGHETDFTVADLVADVRAPTPSAAAEMVIAERAHQVQFLSQAEKRLVQNMTQLLRQYRQRLRDLLRHPLLASPTKLLGLWMQRLDDLRQALDQGLDVRLKNLRLHLTALHRQALSLRPSVQIRHLRQRLAQFDQALCSSIKTRLSNLQQAILDRNQRLVIAWTRTLAIRRRSFDSNVQLARLDKAWQRQQQLRRERLSGIQTALASIDPKTLLGRGFSILFSEKDGSIINSVQCLKRGQLVTIMLSDGHAKATIAETKGSDGIE